MNNSENKIYVPHELKKIEMDIENKIFLINGEEFGKGCKSISIHCNPPEWKFRVVIDKPIEFQATFDLNGKEITTETGKEEKNNNGKSRKASKRNCKSRV